MIAFAAAGCSNSSPTTTADAQVTTVVAIPTPAPSTPSTPTTVIDVAPQPLPDDPTGSVAVDGGRPGCILGGPSTEGTVTVLVGDRLMSSDGSCLAELGPDGAGRITWSPDGTRALLDGDRILDANGIRPSGYRRDNADVQWSGPKGTSMLGTTSSGELVKRNATTGQRTDISFLGRHDSSTYHPAGRAVVSLGVGTGPEGDEELGVWLADNVGGEARLLVRDESAASISEPRFDASGGVLYFLAQHDEVSHVHAYDTGSASLSEAYSGAGILSALTVSALSDGAWAVRQGECNDASIPAVIADFGDGTGVQEVGDLPALRGGRLEPVGWLPERRLLVLSRPACDRPGTVWEVTSKGVTTPVVVGADGAAVRAVRGVPADLLIPINAEVVA